MQSQCSIVAVMSFLSLQITTRRSISGLKGDCCIRFLALSNYFYQVIQIFLELIIKCFKAMNRLLFTLLITYLLSSCYLLIDGFKLFKKGNSLSPEEVFLSLIVLLIVTVFGPLLIPISAIQSLKVEKLELGNVMPLILVIFLVSLLTVSGLVAFKGIVL